MQKSYCDRCGLETPEEELCILKIKKRSWVNTHYGTVEEEWTTHSMDLCQKCAETVLKYAKVDSE